VQATNITHNAKKLPMLSQGIEIYTTDPYWTELHIQKYKTYYSRTLIIFLCRAVYMNNELNKTKYRKFKTETSDTEDSGALG
jgi:predicted ferric reductase